MTQTRPAPDTLRRSDFPAGFTFGVATSAYQIEGATSEDGRGPSIWDTFCREPGRIRDGSSGDVACDHYHRWEADLDLIAALGVNAYRFSVAWPRVQPDGRGPVNAAGLDFYERLTDGLLARGIEPHVTLYHWDLPQPLQDTGGWPNRDTAERFAEYSAAVAGRLGDRVRSYATLNEPWCSSILSYEIGEHAPGLRDRRLALAAAHGLLLGHGLALPELRRQAPHAAAGIVLNLGPQMPASDRPEDVAAARLADGRFNRWFLEPLLRGEYPRDVWEACSADVPEVREGDLALIAAPLDFLGVNYYSRGVLSASGGGVPAGAPVTAMGWEIYPQGLTDLLLRLQADYPSLPPILITENGAAFTDRLEDGRVHDPERVRYLQTHLAALRRALDAGVDVRGYFAWSLMDNFEWAYGYEKRFGLVYVDYPTQTRVLKDSGHWYRQFLR
ncbi:GH1 family beta-glucosidase [Deinococcus sp. S9]|uniref:GH1 family beta-glucosidase n=1 Tax=Deinococcus sp. S9 TaxID=2545754 RepID=UPI00105658AC|nr:GH1 family beta-glucosidase [Deinococcus sp. S9]TDE85607.1 beta-glucosidase [Deinococcus sp. S9]